MTTARRRSEGQSQQVADYDVDYVGMDLAFDGMAIARRRATGAPSPPAWPRCERSTIGNADPDGEPSGPFTPGWRPRATSSPCSTAQPPTTGEALAKLARAQSAHGHVRAIRLDELADTDRKVKAAGVADLVLTPAPGLLRRAGRPAQLRRLALKKNFQRLGFPIIAFPGEGSRTDGRGHAWPPKRSPSMRASWC